jgi:RsiW-degrading membrane proteinase PrsW (M82 family)
MNHRTKTLWMPGLISLTAAMVFLMVSELVSPQPRFLLPDSFGVVHTGSTSANVLLVAYLPWLVLLPLCGAAGAFLSRRAGGQRPARLAAGMFPWTALFLLVTFLTLIGQIVPFKHEWIGFVTELVLVSIPPGIALLLGVIPFLKEARPTGLARTQS